MRQIVVDVGNTSTAVGLWTDGCVSQVSHCDGGFAEASAVVERLAMVGSRVPRDRDSSAGGRGRAPSRPADSLAYVSVVPGVDRRWRAFAKKLNLPFHQITYADFAILSKYSKIRQFEDSKISSLALDYPHPETIGADRLADAAGAVSRYGAPVLVMDFGTALTAAVVTRDRVWRGGVIAPGFPLMRDYLFERTAKLPRMELGKGRPPKIGRSTEDAMRFGALVGYRGMVREIVTELRRNFKEDFRLVATGGFARWALRDIGLDFTIDPTLTLYGAGLVASGDPKNIFPLSPLRGRGLL